MGNLNIIKSAYHPHEVSALLSKLLGHQSGRIKDPVGLAGQLTELAWQAQAARLNRSDGTTPHKLVLAAIACTQGYRTLPDPGLHRGLTVALSNILAEIEVNGNLPLDSLDSQLLNEASETFAEMLNAYNKAQASVP